MAPPSLQEAKKLFGETAKIKNLNDTEIVVAAPFIYLELLINLSKKSKIKLAAQDVLWENPPVGGGAYTGEISPNMLKNLGVEYVIIGHSERRQNLKETDEMINKKIIASVKAGLKVILCVGEPKRNSIKQAKNYIKKQLEKDLKGIPNNYKLKTNQLIIAYEPVWAISTNKNAKPDTPENALQMTKFIKNFLKPKTYNLKPKVIYGGSVSSKNIEGFLRHEEIEGALVGGASLTSDFVKIIKIAQKYS